MVTFYVKVVAVIIIYIYSTEIFVNCILTGMLKKNNPNWLTISPKLLHQKKSLSNTLCKTTHGIFWLIALL